MNPHQSTFLFMCKQQYRYAVFISLVHAVLFILPFQVYSQSWRDSLDYWQQARDNQAICRAAKELIQTKQKGIPSCEKMNLLSMATAAAIELFKPEEALVFARIAQSFDCKEDTLRYKAMMREAIACNLLEKMDSAVLLTQKVIDYCNQTGNTDLLISAHTNLGMMLNKQGAFSDAKEAFLRARDLLRNENNPRRIATAFLNIALCHINLKEYDQGLITVDSGIVYADMANVAPLKNHALALKADIYRNKKDIPNWLSTLDEAIQGSFDAGIPVQAAYGLNDKFNYYTEVNDFPNAILNGKKVLSILEGTSQFPVLKSTYKNFYGLYKKMGNPSQSLFYLEKYIHLRDSLDKEDIDKQIQELNLKYKTAENKAQLIEQKLEIKKDRIWILSALILIVIMVGVLIIILWKNSIHKKNIHQLFLKEKEMDMQFTALRNLIPANPSYSEEESLGALINRCTHLIEREKLYLNPEFSRDDLAQLLNTNRSYLSQAINEFDPNGFRSFINRYRINEAKTLLWAIASEETEISMGAIWQLAGFNSQQTYYRTFKSHTNLTPKEYLDQVKLELAQK